MPFAFEKVKHPRLASRGPIEGAAALRLRCRYKAHPRLASRGPIEGAVAAN